MNDPNMMQLLEGLVNEVKALKRRITDIEGGATPNLAFTSGSVLFANATTGNPTEDNANLFFDNANNRLGIRTNSPRYSLDVIEANGTPIRFGATNTDAGGFLVSTGDTQAIMAGGAAFDGTNWRAKATSAGIYSSSAGSSVIYGNTGLTPGNTFTPGAIAQFDPASSGKFRVGAVASSCLQMKEVSLANNAVGAVSNISGNDVGIVFILDSGGAAGIFGMTGGNHLTTLISNPSGVFSITAGNATTTNVYWSAGNTRYEIENKRGAARDYKIFIFDFS